MAGPVRRGTFNELLAPELRRAVREQQEEARLLALEQQRLMDIRGYCSCAVMDACCVMPLYPGRVQWGWDVGYTSRNTLVPEDEKKSKKERRKPFKAECFAQQLLREVIGFSEWQIYRQTYIVGVKASYVWLIGNVFRSYSKFHPLDSKPDVVRIDQKGFWGRILSPLKEGVPMTKFCVDDQSNEQMPYSDKVLSRAVQCAHYEEHFYKMANRIGEATMKKMPLMALYDPKEA